MLIYLFYKNKRHIKSARGDKQAKAFAIENPKLMVEVYDKEGRLKDRAKAKDIFDVEHKTKTDGK